MSAGLAEALKSELMRARALALELGREPSEWVFTDARGGRLDAQNFRQRVWKPLLAKAGLRHVRVHDLRHSWTYLDSVDGEGLEFSSRSSSSSSWC